MQENIVTTRGLKVFCFNGNVIRKLHIKKNPYLGLAINENFTWQQHVNELRHLPTMNKGIMYHVSHILPDYISIHIKYLIFTPDFAHVIEVFAVLVQCAPL